VPIKAARSQAAECKAPPRSRRDFPADSDIVNTIADIRRTGPQLHTQRL
jgi:hypothetical protein